MKINAERIVELGKIEKFYQECADKKFENYISKFLDINENFISDLESLLTNKEMEEVYKCFENFSIEISISAQINDEKRFSDNKLIINKSGKFINVCLSTYNFIYSILRYDCEKKIVELLPDNSKFKTKMPSFLLARLFFEELELIMQTKIQQTRIKSIYNKNRY